MRSEKRYNGRSIIMVCLILAFIVGAGIGVAHIFDFSLNSDENTEDNVAYVDVTNNVTYYENASQNSSQDYSSDNEEYSDANLNVLNSSK